MDFGLCGFSGLVSRSSCPGDSLRGSMRMYDTSELHTILVVEDTREQRERERGRVWIRLAPCMHTWLAYWFAEHFPILGATSSLENHLIAILLVCRQIRKGLAGAYSHMYYSWLLSDPVNILNISKYISIYIWYYYIINAFKDIFEQQQKAGNSADTASAGQAFHLRWAEVDWSLPLDRSDGREGGPLMLGRDAEKLQSISQMVKNV